MALSNFYFIALKPSLPEELATRSIQSNLLSPSNLEAIVKPVYLPLSFQFNTDEDGIFELGNALQKTLNSVPSFSLLLSRIQFNSTFKQISIQPEQSVELQILQKKIIDVLLEWNNFAHSPVAFEFPKAEVALARSNWSDSEFEKAKTQAQMLVLEQTWTIETVSMMEWTQQGWNEKFFFPLEDQRLLRNQSNTILQDK
ncbi:MAG: hypothetical protein RLZZ71_1234 [Bacteroidota bacterium]|jgi:hypothetical protein